MFVLESLEWVALAVSIIIVYWMPMETKSYKYVQSAWLAPPRWVFPVVWTILYGLIAAATFLFWRAKFVGDVPVDYENYWEAGMLLIGINLLLNKIWTPVFFTFHMATLALAIALGLVGTSGAILGISIYLYDYVGIVPILFFGAYTTWLGFAVFLNSQYALMYTKKSRAEYL